MPANPTSLSFLGVAKESTKGTFVAATDYIPVTKCDPQDMTEWLTDNAWRGTMAQDYNKVQGPIWSELSLGGPVFPDTVGYAVAGVLGDVTTTGASAPFTHAVSLKNSSDGQPISYSLNDFDSVDNRGYTGIQFYELTFSWDGEKYLTWDGAAKGFTSATQTKPTASFSAITGIPGWLSVFQIGGSGNLTLVDAEVALKRQGDPIHTADGTQAPYEIFVGELEVTGKCTIVADTATQLTNYLAGTKTSLDFNFTQGAGANLVQVKLHCNNVNYDLAHPVRGQSYVQYEITWEALANTTDVGASGGQSPIKITLQNAKPASTYV